MAKMKRLLCAIMAGVMSLNTTAMAEAVRKTVALGDVVSISMADIRVLSGYKSLDEVKNQYQQDRADAASSFSDVETNEDKLLQKLLEDCMPGWNSSEKITEMSNQLPNKEKKTMSYEKFEDMTRGYGDDIRKRYEEALEEARKRQNEGSVEEAKKIKEMVEKAMEGVNPFTGEPFSRAGSLGDLDVGELPDYGIDEDGFFSNLDNMTSGDIKPDFGKDFYNDYKTVLPDLLNMNDHLSQGDGDREYPNQDYYDSLNPDNVKKTKKYDRILKRGQYEDIPHRRLSDSDCSNDELVYTRNADDYTDIMYRCGTCGELYGFKTFCACHKYLDGSIHLKAQENRDLSFHHFEDDGTAHTPKVILFSHTTSCFICGKAMKMDSLKFGADENDKFYYTDTGFFECGKCHQDYIDGKTEYSESDNKQVIAGNLSPEELEQNFPYYQFGGVYTQTETVYWSDEYDRYIIPCQALLPENNGDTTGVEEFLDFVDSLDDGHTGISDEMEEMMEDYNRRRAEGASNKELREELDNRFKEITDKMAEDQKRKTEEMFDRMKKKERIDEFYDNANTDFGNLDDFYNKYKDGLLNTPSGGEIADELTNKPLSQWSDDDLRKLWDAIDEAYNNGVPGSEYNGPGSPEYEAAKKKIEEENGGTYKPEGLGEKIKDTVDYENNINKIFGFWPANRDSWTDEQKRFYDEFERNFTNSPTLNDMVEKGVFGKDKTSMEIWNSINNYIAGYTGINDQITIVTTVDNAAVEDHLFTRDYNVQGAMKARVINASGQKVWGPFTAIDSLSPLYWAPSSKGDYTVNRSVDIYKIKWDISRVKIHMKAEAELPDGTYFLLAEKEVNRIVEDKSGMKQYNSSTREVDPIYVTVTGGNLDVDKVDFYDTERIN